MQLSERLCRFVAETRFEDLSEQTVAATCNVLLDATGVIYAASGISEDVTAMLAMATVFGQGECAVLGTGKTTSAPYAAFANGAMAHALDYEDTYDPVPGHPNASLVPAVLAMAQHLTPVDGKKLITALAVGCDAACRISESFNGRLEDGGWYPPPLIGGLAAVFGVSHVLGLDWQQTRNALSLMMCQLTMPGEISFSPKSTIRAVREAFPAQAAVQSALLAKAGIVGFELPLEGRAGFYRMFANNDFDEARLFQDLGQHYAGDILSFKPYPSCRATHPFIEMAINIMARENLHWQDIDNVIVFADELMGEMLCFPLEVKRNPHHAIAAKFSIPFTVSLAVVRGGVSLDDFDDASLHDEQVLAFAERVGVEIVAQPSWTGAGGGIQITLRDGRMFSDEDDVVLGDPGRPMSRAQMVDKFVDCCTRAAKPLTKEQAVALAERILSAPNETDIGALFWQ